MIPSQIKNAFYSKKIRRTLKNRNRAHKNFDDKLGLITDINDVESLEIIAGIAGELRFKKEDFSIVLCDSEIVSSSNLDMLHLRSKEISASGNFKSEAIRAFASNSHELLLCYFTEKNIIGSMLAAETNARLIFGNKPDDFGIYDVEITAENAKVFQQEVLKYYRIFKTK